MHLDEHLIHKLMEYLKRRMMCKKCLRDFSLDKPVGIFNSTISSSGTRSRCLINDRTELPCAQINTLAPERIIGTISSYQYGKRRSTVSFKHSVNGKTRLSKFFKNENDLSMKKIRLLKILGILDHFVD